MLDRDKRMESLIRNNKPRLWLLCTILSGSNSFYTSMKPVDPDKMKAKDISEKASRTRKQDVREDLLSKFAYLTSKLYSRQVQKTFV